MNGENLARLMSRVLVIVLALSSVIITATFGFAEVKAVGMVNVAALLADGDKVRPLAMNESVTVAMGLKTDGFCVSNITRAGSVILFAELQARLERGDFDEAEAIRGRLGELNERTLKCAPGSGFDWFLRYWYQAVVKLDQQAAFSAALMSYHAAPNEGWVIVRRLPFLLPAYDIAPAKLQRNILGDFKRLALAQSVSILADIYWRSNAKLKALFRIELAGIPYQDRVELADKLRRAGIEIDLPGVPPPTVRPWKNR